MGVSINNGTPQIIHFNRVFHYTPSILGGKHPYFWFNTQIGVKQTIEYLKPLPGNSNGFWRFHQPGKKTTPHFHYPLSLQKRFDLKDLKENDGFNMHYPPWN